MLTALITLYPVPRSRSLPSRQSLSVLTDLPARSVARSEGTTLLTEHVEVLEAQLRAIVAPEKHDKLSRSIMETSANRAINRNRPIARLSDEGFTEIHNDFIVGHSPRSSSSEYSEAASTATNVISHVGSLESHVSSAAIDALRAELADLRAAFAIVQRGGEEETLPAYSG